MSESAVAGIRLAVIGAVAEEAAPVVGRGELRGASGHMAREEQQQQQQQRENGKEGSAAAIHECKDGGMK